MNTQGITREDEISAGRYAVEDTQSLVGVGLKVVETDVNGETSENDSFDEEKKDKNRGGRDKAIVKEKGRGSRRSRARATEMDVEWDYNLASVAVTLPTRRNWSNRQRGTHSFWGATDGVVRHVVFE